MTEPSLRERSKQRRRRALQLAGMRLFAEQGYDATTVVQIAAAAEVSTRSVAAYFPTKLDIAAASSNDAADRLMDAFQAARSNLPVVEVFMAWLEEEVALVDEEEWRLRAQMLEANPVLTSLATTHSQALVTATSEALECDLRVPRAHPAVRLGLGVLGGIVLQCQLLTGAQRTDPEILRTIRAAVGGALDGIRRAAARDGSSAAAAAEEPIST